MSDLHFVEGPKGTMTSESYTRMVEAIEAEIKRVKAENNPENKARLTALKKEKRALKNKASAMRCREKKRRKMVDLEQTVLALERRVAELEQENKQLRAANAAGTAAVTATVPPPAETSAPLPRTVSEAENAAVAAQAPLVIPRLTRRKPTAAPKKQQHRIHYTAPSKRRPSSDLIITSSSERPRYDTVAVKKQSAGAESSTKMAHSRTHAVATGPFSESDLDFSDFFGSDDGVAAFGGVMEGPDFLNVDALFWEEPVAAGASAGNNDVGGVVDSFIQGGGNQARTLIGAL